MNSLKLRKIGNSLGVILPTEVLGHLQVAEGDEIFAVSTPRGIQLSRMSPSEAEDLEIAERLMARHRPVLDLLSK
jgi:putative addiction module antidote